MERLAIDHQQIFYEQLPNWLQYRYDEYNYIKQNIGFALFGTQAVTEISDKRSQKNINKIYENIIKYNRRCSGTISIGVIYNVIFQHVVNNETVKKNNESTQEIEEICAVPVFKVKQYNNEILYIDHNARIYQSWSDYLSNNTLPQCVMVVPKDGVYQCNPGCEVTEHSSFVWLHTLMSPACGFTNTVLDNIDTASNILGVATAITLGVTSFLTPVGPILAGAGLITSGICGSWNLVRNSQKLIDRSNHNESINPLNRNALPIWLNITGTSLTLGASGGTMLLSKAIANGSNITTVAKTAFNSLIVGNLTINGISVAYQSCRLIDKYRENGMIDVSDIIVFSSSVLFFTNSVLTAKLAGEYMELSKGTVFEKFKNALRFNRFYKEYNRIKGFVTQERSGDITYEVKSISSIQNLMNGLKNLKLTFKIDKITVSGIRLIDPIVVTEWLLTVGLAKLNNKKYDSTSKYASEMITLTNLMSHLLQKFFCNRKNSKGQYTMDNKLNNVACFNEILTELKHINNAPDILKMIFKISEIMIQFSNKPEQLLHNAVFFVWQYCRANLEEYCKNSCFSYKNSNLDKWINETVTFIFDVIHVISFELYSAFRTYISNTEPLRMHYKI